MKTLIMVLGKIVIVVVLALLALFVLPRMRARKAEQQRAQAQEHLAESQQRSARADAAHGRGQPAGRRGSAGAGRGRTASAGGRAGGAGRVAEAEQHPVQAQNLQERAADSIRACRGPENEGRTGQVPLDLLLDPLASRLAGRALLSAVLRYVARGSSSAVSLSAVRSSAVPCQPAALAATAGRRGRCTSSPPQLGQAPASSPLAELLQNVHS